MIYDFVFVVLVYRNTDDLKDFFANLDIPNSKTIVVNSFYDELSENKFHNIASINEADFFSVPNKGYGAGNNVGCEYALKNYSFKYLVITNADIEIFKLKISDLKQLKDYVIAPNIITNSGKHQNPSEPFTPGRLIHTLMKNCYKGDHNKLIWVFYAWCRAKRIIYNTISVFARPKYIYSAHGSFLIIPHDILTKLHPIYNEKMFLMNEEGHLAKKCQHLGIKTVYLSQITILHKEDGSMSLEYSSEFKILKQSFLEFYDNWYN